MFLSGFTLQFNQKFFTEISGKRMPQMYRGQLFKAGLAYPLVNLKFKANFPTACLYKFGNSCLEILSESVGVFFSEVLK
jgi:hypothetical protein